MDEEMLLNELKRIWMRIELMQTEIDEVVDRLKRLGADICKT